MFYLETLDVLIDVCGDPARNGYRKSICEFGAEKRNSILLQYVPVVSLILNPFPLINRQPTVLTMNPPNSCRFEIYSKPNDPTGKTLANRHLNFTVKYDVIDGIILHKCYVFHDLQVRPSISICRNGTCDEAICKVSDDEFISAEDTYNKREEVDDPAIGKLVKLSEHGFVSFRDPDGDDDELDLNWKRLRNMAWPIVDHQLAKIAIEGKWKTQPVRVNLGTLMLDNTVIRFDPNSYNEMEKDDKKDLESCKTAWLKKLRCELAKRGIERADDGTYAKRTHNDSYHGNYGVGEKENGKIMNGSDTKKFKIAVNNESGLVKVENEERVVKVSGDDCVHCGEDPCVWLVRKGVMILFDENEHGHFPYEDKPPNNTRRKKVYREMTKLLHGPLGAGNRKILPKCVENGARALFPSPSFMGFKSK